MPIDALFSHRRAHQQQQVTRYFKYIFNDHFVIALMFLFGALMVQYAEWIQTLHTLPNAPTWLVGWVVLVTLFVRFGRLATYLSEADLVFLLPAEAEVRRYLKRAYRHSLWLPSAGLLLVLAASFPFLEAIIGMTLGHVLGLFLLLVVMKAADLLVVSENAHHHTSRDRQALRLGVSIATFSLLNWSVFAHPVLALLIALGFYVALWYFLRPFQAGRPWDWEHLIAREERRQQQIQTLLGLFVETQKGEQTVRRRRWLDSLLSAFTPQETVFLGLYQRSFLREGAWLGLWGRLLVIGSIILCFLPLSPLSWLVMGLLLFLSGIQLLPLAKRYQRHALLRTYPLAMTDQLPAFQRMLARILGIEGGIFAVIVGWHFFPAWGYIAISWAVLAAVGTFFVFGYLPGRLTKPTKRGKKRR